MTSESESPNWTRPVPSLVGGTSRQLTAVLDRFEDLWRALDQRLAGIEAVREERHLALLALIQADKAEVISQIAAHTDALRQELNARIDETKAAIAASEAGVVSQISAHTDVLRQDLNVGLDEAKAVVVGGEARVISQIAAHTDVLRQELGGLLASVVAQLEDGKLDARIDQAKAAIGATETEVVHQISAHTNVLRQELGGMLTTITSQLDGKAESGVDLIKASIGATETEVVHQISTHTNVLRRLVHNSRRGEPVEPDALTDLMTALREVNAQLARLPAPLDLLNEAELSLLTPDERDVTPAILEVSPPIVHRHAPAETLEIARLDPPAPRYVDLDGAPVTVDETLPPLLLRQSNEDPENPVFWAEPPKASDQRRTYWFEFDTTPTFTSPNTWRSPILAAREGVLRANELAGEALAEDRPNRSINQGLTLTPLVTLDPFGSNDLPMVRAPFRLSAMRLPTGRAALDWNEMQRQAQALGAGLPREALRREIFNYVRHVYGWGLDTRVRNGAEIFMSGMGGCGHVGTVAAIFLELNGVRTRKVAGFNPKLRSVWAGAGHTALEVQEESGDWSYFDPYLGYYTPHVSAKDIAEARAPQVLPYLVLPQDVAAKVGFEQYDLSKLFRYRIYFDTFDRLLPVNAPRLGSREAAYAAALDHLEPGQDWAADDLKPPSDQIHVRVRYAIGANSLIPVGARFGATNKAARFSPWTTASFPAPWAATKPPRRKAAAPPRS